MVYNAYHGVSYDYTKASPTRIEVHLRNEGNFMLFTEPCNGAGAKKITEEAEMEILDIVPSKNSHSLYARVEVRSMWDTKIIGVGYVSLRAAALNEAIVHKHHSYITAEGVRRFSVDYEVIKKIKEFDL